uniref:Structural maintenance of chromosomes protein n=1 Tax=Ganoderma boninense TaxID=34458 RepID=A0A5K1JWQ2_9APHY|nr:Structural maintenance of chromosomes protein [Ganoderma boninense]
MPLVRIEVCDFKSPPKGAGKSNLMDAISFVLGVKSAQLRSSQLKDLVYRGRRLARNPDGEDGGQAPPDEDDEEGEGEGEGTAKKAWVLAVYEDAAKKEWKFQRTISTTGASEYKLNNKVVSYSAYNAALIQHNILVKAKNFLVFQGDVEAVASQSPKELSRLIDQISGSLELAGDYEKARDGLERATENATFNFTKRRGMMGEIKQYKEQKGEAERFEQLCQERDDLVLRRILYRLFHIQQSLDEHAQAIRDQNKALVGLRKEQQRHEKALEEARSEQAKTRGSVMKKEKKIKTAEKALEAQRPDLVRIEAQIKHAERKREKAEQELEKLRQTESEQKRKLQSLQADLDMVKKAANAAQEAQRRAAQQNLSLSEESKAAASVLAVDERQSLQTLTRDEKTASRTLAQLKDKSEQQTQKREKLAEEERTLSQKTSELEAKVFELAAELKRVRQEHHNQQAERTRIEKLEKETNEKLVNIYEQLTQAGVDQQESQRETRLKETLSNLQRIFPGVRGRVVDLCKPTQRKYETSVAVVLGRNIDAIVVDEEKTAIDCIEYMRNQRAGQATFIPLDTIQVKPINDKFRAFAKGARLAVDVITYDPAVERAMHHACGNALVCDSMEVARYVCYEKGQEVKAVTLEGTIIHKSGLITGGKSSQTNGKKWEEKDVQGLTRARDNFMAQLLELGKSKPRGQETEVLLAEITRLESAHSVARDDLGACKAKLNGVRDEVKHIDREIRQIQPELRKAQTAYNKVKEQVDALAAVINEAEDGIFADFCEQIGVDNIREYEERQLKLAQAESEARLQFDTQIARLTHASQFAEEQMNMTRERVTQYQEILTTEGTNLARLEQERAQAQAGIAEAEDAIRTLQEELKDLTEEMEEKTKRVDEVKKTTSKAGKVLDQAIKEIATHRGGGWGGQNDEIEKVGLERSAIYRKCRLDEITLPLVAGNLKHVPMEENLRDEVAMDVDEDEQGTQRVKRVPDYGIEVDFDSLSDADRDDASGDVLKEIDDSIAKTTSEIERMAPNMKAVDRLDDVEAKMVETEKEAEKARKDSKSARDQFNEIKRKRCELFNKAYNHISERIDQVYKDLTKGKMAPTGGVAYLTLEDSEARTLYGRYQPSPFFVLDEVDAALDNTNVAKIANYIRVHSSDTFQFIVISLKGSLYERSNSLVGIYRDQDVNSSRTLTLDLTQYDD